MAGAEKDSKNVGESSKMTTDNFQSVSPPIIEDTSEDQTITKDSAKTFEHLDSIEKLEARLLSLNSIDESNRSESEKGENDFSEDYSIKDGTYLDTGKFNDPRTFDLIRDLETLERLRKLEMENEEDLERREVAALIKRGEEKLLPTEKYMEEYEAITESEDTLETATESQVIVPELVELEKPLSASDLIRMESSDLSEEEGFRLRLSCILEESESDTASMSGSLIKQLASKELSNISDQVKTAENIIKAKEDQPRVEDVEGQSEKQTSSERVLMSNIEISPLDGDKDTIHGLEAFQDTAVAEMNANRSQNENYIAEINNLPPSATEQGSVPLEQTAKASEEDSIGTPSQSPEPKSFGIQKLKSGSNVDKLLIRPVIVKRLESSSESSLDLSTTLSSPGADAESCDIMELDVTRERLSRTPDNVTIQLDKSSESPIRNTAVSCDITEMTEEDVDALFPKIKKRRRGKSLESGMAEKANEERDQQEKEHAKLETKSQKGEEERPPVPPETYLWEELRRWRLKGGYPWTYLDKPPFDEETWKQNTDHEYEPINPPPLDKPHQEGEDAWEERRFLRIPRDEELVLSAEDMEVEAIAAAQDLQDDLEGRFLATTPMTTTTASRTDCDVNTSMLDSSGLEDLPLKRGSRTKKAIQSKTEQMRAQAQGIQQRLRSQAGKLRNKLRSIPRPSFQRKQERERQRTSPTEPQKSRFRLPERPKISLPERPKFNFPERPKFKMPQKPKLNLPHFSNPLKERQVSSLQTEPRRKMFDIDFKTYPRMFSKKSRDRGDYATSSPKLQRSATPPPAPIQPARKKGPIGQRWVNRFDDIQFVDDKASEVSHKSELSESLSGFHDKDFAITEDIDQTQLPPARTLSTKSSLSHLSDREEVPSSRSSEEHPRKGVIEEIDSDQFFLRQKGISEEDIDMGKYLSEEIREAFRSPVVNALRQLDYDYENEVEKELDIKNKENEDPLPPTRMRSLKKMKAITKEPSPTRGRAPSSNEDSSKFRYENVVEPELPPANISNVREHQQTRYENLQQRQPSRYENIEENARNRYDNSEEGVRDRHESVGDSVKDRYGTIEDNGSEYYKSPPAPVEYQHYKVPRVTPTPTKRKSSATEQGSNKKKHNGWVEVEVETTIEKVEAEPIPQPLKRKKSKKSLGGKQESSENEYTPKDATEPDYIIPNDVSEITPPDPPRRFRSLSRGARSVHSLAQEEEEKKHEAPHPTAPLRYRSLSREARSTHSLAQEEQGKKSEVSPPDAPVRYRSLSRGARSVHSLAQEEEQNKPIPPKRTSSKRSLHSLGLETRSLQKREHDTRSLHSLAMEHDGKHEAQKRTMSLSRGSRSFQSIEADQEPQTKPTAPERTRSNSRGSRSYHSLAEDGTNMRWTPRDEGQSNSLSRNFKARNEAEKSMEAAAVRERGHIYESPTDGYAVVDKGASKPKPPRPPPPRRKKGSQSPNFNTFPRRSPVRPIRAYATLGPSRPPRKSKPKPARSIEHIYQSDQISQAYVEVEDTLKPTQTEDLHGSNKDLQTDEVIEKMKGRPLPAPPRPPRLRTRTGEPSMEEVEEVCAATQTDPLPDDLILEDDMIQELSHDDYKMQEAFLQAMREEDERIQRDIEERNAKKLAAEAQKALEREQAEQLQKDKRGEQERQIETEPLEANPPDVLVPPRDPTRPKKRQSDDLENKKKTLQLEAEDDMGYASLDRRQPRTEEEHLLASTSAQQSILEEAEHQRAAPVSTVPDAAAGPVNIPLVPEITNTENLRFGTLEVDRLQVNELLATSLQVQDLRAQSLQTHDLRGTALHIQDITSHAGELHLGNIELPPDFLQQIIARIPWEQLRPQQSMLPEQEGAVQSVQRRPTVVDEEPITQQATATTTIARRRHRHLRQHSSRSQYSSDEEDTARPTRRQLRTASVDPNIVDLSRQLARACTNAGFRAMREFADRVRVAGQEEDQTQYIKAVLCILFVAIAGYFLIWHHGKDIHHHHWDFQFPPQPPKQ